MLSRPGSAIALKGMPGHSLLWRPKGWGCRVIGQAVLQVLQVWGMVVVALWGLWVGVDPEYMCRSCV